ncbi:hypothetical protein A6E01_20720 (plasmid) [Vibrio breoganii]|uniref:Potassium channel domain-containing protein n=1 Tax=Vibrio breoganii TaxID=553239 RepID=A0AAN0XZK1_9VIBR|nr:ion channel [Vibrio breoganii]ANO35637.1 hypothetical protein A6E01_20720 [Vibrio breoganii]PML19303.1 hypothetical protein BCT84_18690 [Vibrio breoganii]
MSLTERRVSKLKRQLKFLLMVHLFIFSWAYPIYVMEVDVDGATVTSIWSSVFYLFTSLSSIGFGHVVVQTLGSEVLTIMAYVVSRGAMLVSLASIGVSFLGKPELTEEDRLVLIERKLELVQAELHEVNREYRRAKKEKCRSEKTITPVYVYDSAKVEEARAVLDWHIFSDKVSEPKVSNMTLEEAELILFHESNKSLKGQKQ